MKKFADICETREIGKHSVSHSLTFYQQKIGQQTLEFDKWLHCRILSICTKSVTNSTTSGFKSIWQLGRSSTVIK